MGVGLLAAVVTGALIALQVFVLGRSATSFDALAVSLALQLAGLIAGITYVAVRGRWSDVAAVAGRWWWLPLGALGWGVVGALGFASARSGVAATLAASITAQLVVGWLLDR